MENITNFTNYKINEATVEIEETEEGVYVLTLDDIKDIVAVLADNQVSDDDLLGELSRFKFVKVDDPTITPVDGVEEIDELSSDDENPNFIKKFEKS